MPKKTFLGAPASRVVTLNDTPARGDGKYVLYWMIGQRRLAWNFALDRAIALAKDLGKPLLIFEPLRIDYRWASERLHGFIMQGMVEHRELCRRAGVAYYPYVEETIDAGKGLLAALAKDASVVVTDDVPGFFLPRMVKAAARAINGAFEMVDSNGLLPVRASDRVYVTAYQFRRAMQKALPTYLSEWPREAPFRESPMFGGAVWSKALEKRWPPFTGVLREIPLLLARLPIDHAVGVTPSQGGRAAALSQVATFLDGKLARYAEARSDPEADAASGLSPYLHFGNISSHEVVSALMQREGWSAECLAEKANGGRSGWWGMSAASEAFLDELITWRELGFNMCALTEDYDSYSSLPDWARRTLEEHSDDEREYVYTLEEFAESRTHDELWNAAQSELRITGRMQNYLRMLWGKKILEWTAKPQDALTIMLELNNRYALDGRDPNSYSGIFWCLGRYDRPWGPERPVFGTIRYMSSDNTRRKFKLSRYIARFGTDERVEGKAQLSLV